MIVKSDAVQFLDGAVVIWHAFSFLFFFSFFCFDALCVCRPSAGFPKTQLFNEHIDQCFSHLHFPHREKEREREEKKRTGKKGDEEKKALEKL